MHIYRDLFQYAHIAYQRPTGNEPLFDGNISFSAINIGLDYALIVEFQERVIIAFRGTGTTSDGIKSVRTWLSDLDIYPLRGPTRLVRQGRDPHVVLVQAGILKDGSWGRGTIHDGFYTTWRKFKRVMTSYLIKFKDKPLYITGHSRGGALAELCARHVAKNMGKSCILVEYGTPRVGTEEYANQFQTLHVTGASLVNGYDLVMTVPPKILGFHRAINKTKMVQPFWHMFFHRVRDHFQENYVEALKKYYP